MRLFCCILMGFILMWGLQVIRIIRSCPGWDYYICRRRTYANSLIFLSWFVLLSLTLSIVPGLSYAQYRLILILGYHLTLSHLMHTPLKKQSQYSGPIPNTQGSPHHSSHWGREGKNWKERRQDQEGKAQNNLVIYPRSPSELWRHLVWVRCLLPTSGGLLLSLISLERVVGMGVPWEVQLLWDELWMGHDQG